MAGSKNGPALHPTTLELAQGPNFAVITTALPGGDFQNHYIWVGTDGERLFVNTEVHRQKFKNVQRDPRVTLTIRDEQDPYRYAEVRGEVVETVGAKPPGTTWSTSFKSTTGSRTRRTRSRPSG
jgi:PPOX class probable F420-dependent enzyme